MKFPKIITVALLNSALFLAIFSPIFAAGGSSEVILIPPIFSFEKDLQFKDNNVDVFFLQIVLNSDLDTSISTAGLGSPGQETTYFGGYTRLAVIKFQDKYASEILAPYGLTEGTGYVGPTTRAKLNQLLIILRSENAANENATSTNSTSTSASTTLGSSTSSSTNPSGQNNSNSSGSSGAGSASSGGGSAAGGLVGAGASAGSSVAANSILKPFGGQVDYVDYYSCSCSGGILIWIQDKVPPHQIKRLVYQAGVTRLNSYYNIFIPGVETVGTYEAVQTVCLAYTGTECTQMQNDGLITPTPFPGVGTTLSPVAS